MERGRRAGSLLALPVCFGDIRLGVVVDLLLDEPPARVLGLDVLCGDRSRRFLPLAAASVGEREVGVASALVLMRHELEFYRVRGRPFSAVRGFPVRGNERELGLLGDFLLDEHGDVVTLVVEGPEGEREVPAAAGRRFGPDALRPAV